MDTDIRKPDTGVLSIARPNARGSQNESRASSGSLTPSIELPPYTEPLSEGEEDEAMDMAVAVDEDKRTGLLHEQAAEAIAFRKVQLEAEEKSRQNKSIAEPESGQRRREGREADAPEHGDTEFLGEAASLGDVGTDEQVVAAWQRAHRGPDWMDGAATGLDGGDLEFRPGLRG